MNVPAIFRSWAVATLLGVIAITSPRQTLGQEPAPGASAPVAGVIDDETWCVFYTDFAALGSIESTTSLVDMLQLFRPDKSAAEHWLAAGVMNLGIADFEERGVSQLWVVASLDDMLRRGGPVMVAPLALGADPEVAMEAIRPVAAVAPVRGENGAAHPAERATAWLADRDVVIAGSRHVVDHYTQLSPVPRPDLTGPIDEFIGGGAVGAIVVSLDADARRAVRELWPQLPPPLDVVTGAFLADEMKWLAVDYLADPKPAGRLMIELRDETCAERLHAWLESNIATMIAALDRNFPVDEPQREATVARFRAALKPRREGARIVLDLEPDGDQIKSLYALVKPAIDAARAAGAPEESQ